jgi:glycosyltransferase involved in cell wall biosynthesis
MNSRLYFLRERYPASAIDRHCRWELNPDVYGLSDQLYTSSYTEQSVDNFSQELLFWHERTALAEYQSGQCKFPFYRRYASDQLWKANPGDSSYADRLSVLYPNLSLELIEALSREAGRGADVLPLPSEPKARWKSVSRPSEGIYECATLGTYESAIVTPRLGIGGGEKVVRELAAALADLTGKRTLIIVADTEHPGGQDVLPLARIRLEDTPFLAAPVFRRAETLRELLLLLDVKLLFSINSFICNYAIQGEFLRSCGIAVASAIFSLPVSASGEIGGFARDVDWFAPNVQAFFTENEAMGRVLREHFFIDNVHVLTVPETVPEGDIPEGRNVLWASRIDEEKRPDLLIEIATSMPDVTFEVWGSPLLSGRGYLDSIAHLKNAVYRGAFDSFAHIDFAQVGCFLYTTRYDGKPNIVVEAMARGLACVATGVGGIPELLADDRGVVLAPEAPAEAYAAAIRGFLASGRRNDQGSVAREYVRKTHTRENFRKGVAHLLETMRRGQSYGSASPR